MKVCHTENNNRKQSLKKCLGIKGIEYSYKKSTGKTSHGDIVHSSFYWVLKNISTYFVDERSLRKEYIQLDDPE